MSDKNPEEILEELEDVFREEGVWEDHSEEIDAYIGSHGLDDPGQTEYEVAKEISTDAPNYLILEQKYTLPLLHSNSMNSKANYLKMQT